jgi:hypothetical protein
MAKITPEQELEQFRADAKSIHKKNRRYKIISAIAKVVVIIVLVASYWAYTVYASEEQHYRRLILENNNNIKKLELEIKKSLPEEDAARQKYESIRMMIDTLSRQQILLKEQNEGYKSFIPKAGAAEYLSFGPLPAVQIKFDFPEKADYDIDKLAYAISFAETASCTDGTAVKRKNCFGIMWWPKGKGSRTPKTYKTHEESYADFKRIWVKSYGKFPDKALAIRWSGNDNADSWLKNVTFKYNSL